MIRYRLQSSVTTLLGTRYKEYVILDDASTEASMPDHTKYHDAPPPHAQEKGKDLEEER